MPLIISGKYILINLIAVITNMTCSVTQIKKLNIPSENFRSRKLSTTKQHLAVLILSDDFLICKVIINNEIIHEILNSELNQCIIWEW